MLCKTFRPVLALLVPLAWASAQAATPAPHAIFAAMKAASGGDRWDAVAELEQHGQIEQGGQQGSCTQYQDLRDGRNASYCTLGKVPDAGGYDGTRSWFMDEKSMVSARESIQALRAAATDAYLARHGWFRGQGADSAQMRYDGRRQEAGRSFDLVHVLPKDGMALEAWIDTRTHLLDRVVEDQDDGSKQVTRYADYRPVDGLLLAYTQRQGNGDAQYDQVLHVQQVITHAAAIDAHFAMPSSTVRDAHIEGQAASATIPFTPYAGLIMVELAIDGAKPLPFVLDTGGLNLLTPEAARKLGIGGAGHQAVQGVGESTQSMQTAQVKRYRLGPVVMEDQKFLIVDLPRLLTDRGAKEPIAGIIGYELLRRFAVRVDYDRQRLTLTPAALFHGGRGAASVPIVFSDRTPEVLAKVDGVSGAFNLDTGDSGELTVFAPFAKVHAIHPQGLLARTKGSGAGGVIDFTEGRVASLAIGPFTVPHPLTSFAAPAKGVFASSLLAGNIGHGILSRFVLTFDYEHRRLYLEQGENFAQESPRSRTGMGLNRVEHDAFVVATVAPDSPAAQAGLRIGDRVLDVDGTPAADMSLDDIQRAMRQPAGTPMQLRVVREGAARQCTLVLRDQR